MPNTPEPIQKEDEFIKRQSVSTPKSAVGEGEPSGVLPVPDFDGPTIVFGAPASSYLTREQLGGFYNMSGRYCDVASSLFYSGGSLAQHGLRFREDIDRAKAMGAIKAWLCSFEPKHEIKIGTVGYALSKWCEDVPAADTSGTTDSPGRTS